MALCLWMSRERLTQRLGDVDEESIKSWKYLYIICIYYLNEEISN